MRRLRLPRLLLAFAILVPGSALAQRQFVRIDFVRSSPTGELPDGTPDLELHDANGGRLAWEYFVSSRIGIEFSIASVEHRVEAPGSTFDPGDLRISQGSVAALVHLTPASRLDLYAGGGVAAVQFDDLLLRRSGAPPLLLEVDDDVTWSLQVGVDVPLGRQFGFSVGLIYVATDADLSGRGRSSLDPWIARGGVLIRY